METEIAQMVLAGFPEPNVREFIEGVARDALCETETLRRIALYSPDSRYNHYSVVDAELPGIFPTDKYFRNRWECPACSSGTVTVNMPKARLIHMDRIRSARDMELVKLDVDFMKVLEAVDTAEQQRIATLKQTLRDIPHNFDLKRLRTPATLKAAWPDDLPR